MTDHDDREPEPDIHPEMPLYVHIPNDRGDDLPDYYTVVTRHEHHGYTPHGTPDTRNVRYAVRPLTAKERELQDARERVETEAGEVGDAE